MKLIPIIISILILAIPAVILLGVRKEIGLIQPNGTKVIYLSGNEQFQFSFISPKNNLDSVIIRLKNISIKPAIGRNSKPIYFDLSEGQQTLSHLQINGSNIIEDDDIRFAFPAIANSENKQFSVILNSPETQKSEELGIHTDNLGNPVMTTYHLPASRVQLIFDIYKSFFEKASEDLVFFIIWVVFFIFTSTIIKNYKRLK